MAEDPPYQTRRARPERAYDKKALVDRIVKFYRQDLHDRTDEIDMRLQRYAKLRGWVEGKDFPWPDASDASVPDIMTASLKTQDTLTNAVLAGSPVVVSKATNVQDSAKQPHIDALIDHQVFVEQPGETILGELIQQYVEDAAFTAHVSWVKEEREGIEIRRYPPLQPGEVPGAVFERILLQDMKATQMEMREAEGWSWRIALPDGARADAEFYTLADGAVELQIEKRMTVYDGPRIMPVSWDNVFYPVGASNLQIPGPSNPRGAGHVILRDYPMVDEIERLVAKGTYDAVSGDDLEAIRNKSVSRTDDAPKRQRQTMSGREESPSQPDGAEGHNRLTRLLAFDVYDIDGDGVAEDVVCWIILETETLLRCTDLSRVYPFSPPRRPLARTTFLPIQDSADGISLPELMEGTHDTTKMIVDQTLDSGTIGAVPFFFYRASGGNRPEIIKLAPGEGYPIGDPQRDVNFPHIQPNTVFGLNMLTLLGSWQERLTNIGDTQLGRVPPGRASALRTVGGMQTLAAQGEGRPERHLRRFFIGLCDIWSMIHQLNQVYLPQRKIVRLRAIKSKNEIPYVEVTGDDIRIQATFEFKANAYNASKGAKQDALNAVLPIYLNPVALQAGIIQPDGIYRLARDVGYEYGVDADQYLTPPSPEANRPRWLVEEVIYKIMNNEPVDCAPAELGGAQEHLQKLMSFMRSPELGHLTADQVAKLKVYTQQTMELARVQAYQQQMAQAMAQFQGGGAGGGQGGGAPTARPSAAGMMQPPMLSGPGEMMDETMPGAGGGASQTIAPGGAK